MTKLTINNNKEYQAAKESGTLELATHVEVRYCDAVTAIDAPNATHIEVRDCDAVTAIDAPNATHIKVRYCDAVTAITIGNTTHPVQNIDGFATQIGGWKQQGDYLVSKGAIIGAGFDPSLVKPVKVVKYGEHYAHGKTFKAAKQDARFKASPTEYDADDLRAEINRKGRITPSDFHLVTGACLEGMRIHLEGAGLDPHAESMPLDEALTAMSGTSYGAQFKRFLEAA